MMGKQGNRAKKNRDVCLPAARKEGIEMVPELARMSVIIKSRHKTSVMTGNYELGYTCGLFCRLAGLETTEWSDPLTMQETVLKALENYRPSNEQEENVLHMLRYYHPDTANDEQVKQLYEWGLSEEHIWQAIVK